MLKFKLPNLLVSLLIGVTLFSTPLYATPPTPTGWTLLEECSDEFSGTSLNQTKWNNGIWYDVSTDLAFKSDNAYVSNGNLVLSAKKETYNGKGYTIGAVESKFNVPGSDSYVEIRAKALDSRANVLSAIWMQSSPLSTLLNPNPEIDIQETFNFNRMDSTLHTWNVNPSIHLVRGSNKANTGVDVSQDYHIYGLERRNGKLKFYFDERLVWETTPSEKSFVELSRHMVLSLEGHLGKPVEAYLPGEFLIDYVRTYYYSDFNNMPTNGTYKIINRKSGQALTIENISMDDGGTLVQFPYNGENNFKWQVTKNGEYTYTMRSLSSNKYVDLKNEGSVASNGTAVIQWSYHGGDNQLWYLVPTDNGYFKIVSALSGKTLCVKNASTSASAPIVQWSYGTAQNDQWAFVPVE